MIFRLVPVIEGRNPLPDSAFNASGCLGSSYKPKYARLNSRPSVESSGSWSPEINDQMQYLQVAFPKLTPLFGVIIQGSPIFDQYVTSFKILHSSDGIAFHYLVDETTHPQIFSGPIDSRTPIKSLFKVPIETKVVRIYPLTWHGSIAIRVELLGCSSEPPQEETVPPLPHIEEEVENIPICIDPLGISEGKMSFNQVKFSSAKQIANEAFECIKLSSKNGWRPVIDSPNEYVLFDFLELRNITGIKTKGGEYGWVIAYTILYSKDMILWNTILNKDGTPKLFLGNVDSYTVKTNTFKLPINARAMKIIPTKWHNCIELKVEPIGCFIPYKIEENIIFATPPPTSSPELPSCGICPGVLYAPLPIEGICRCSLPLFWNGNDCVQRNMCPCVVGHSVYGVGAQYESEDCSKCICVLGGIAQCKPQECPPCSNGTRRIQSASCLCLCEPCPKGDVLCPSSGACIPETAWCDGVQDCPDDELNCAVHYKPEPIKKVQEKITITKTCPTPSCPPGFTLKIGQRKANSKASPMLQTAKIAPSSGYKKIRTDKLGGYRDYQLVFPESGETESIETVDCEEFDCVPERPKPIGLLDTPPPSIHSITCPEPHCPVGYEVAVNAVIDPVQKCTQYKCQPLPQNDAVCNITGRTFNTFDGTEFKYDICNQLLARDIVSQKWSVAILNNCTLGNYVCRKEIYINDKENDLVIILYTDLTLQLDGYKFTVDQLQKSIYTQMKSFIISKVGNAIIFISHLHGFWVRFDELGDVKIGVAAKYSSGVDGLCGYFNGDSSDDKRFPNGTLTLSSVDFGDGWFADEESKKHCEPHKCPLHVQDIAWKLCSNKIKDESFAPCKAMGVDRFISKCLETACECLQSTNNNTEQIVDPERQKTCQCSILQSFVAECLATNEQIVLDTWRARHDCPAKCVAPLVHKDCYRRRCEPSCDLLNPEDCPHLPGVCFSGCYCPDGKIHLFTYYIF